MRLSATQAATGALTAAVVAGLLLLPGRLLGTESGDRAVITLPVTTAPAPVHAAPVVVRTPARKAPAKAPVQLVRAATLVSAPVRATPVVQHATVAPKRSATSRPALAARIVKSSAVRSALARRSGRPTRHETPPDPVLPAGTTKAPAPAPAPTPAPTAPPADAPAAAPAPAPTATTSQPTIVASVEQPAAPTGNGLQQTLSDHPHGDDGGHWHDRAPSPWDGHFGDHGRNRGR